MTALLFLQIGSVHGCQGSCFQVTCQWAELPWQWLDSRQWFLCLTSDCVRERKQIWCPSPRQVGRVYNVPIQKGTKILTFVAFWTWCIQLFITMRANKWDAGVAQSCNQTKSSPAPFVYSHFLTLSWLTKATNCWCKNVTFIDLYLRDVIL